MLIANPIYDVVFKYLMEDAKIAKIMLSSITGENITKLSFLPQEFTTEIDTQSVKKTHKTGLTVYRLDFSAQIQTPEGQKQVIIELQKAKFPTDIIRFRRYLGEQFNDPRNIISKKINKRVRKIGVPIISVYFLGHKLDHTTASAIKVSRQYQDLITNEIIETRESFIESLTLDSYVIQIPYLTQQRRTELEILLSVFDQNNATDVEHHILNVNEAEFPEKYRSIIRKLQQAIQSPEIKKQMQLEDGIIDELQGMDREIEELSVLVEQVKQENEQVKQENEEVKQHAEKERQRADQLSKEKLQTLLRMRAAGLPDADICAFLNINPGELEQMTNFSNDE
ncbi:hypothetical protein [Haliscomenobacter sp.]|uniref:hypothetical protein n=1 Tax=Haliscomenobacter sp. TaxID=2717303 RepID=UPI0035942C81